MDETDLRESHPNAAFPLDEAPATAIHMPNYSGKSAAGRAKLAKNLRRGDTLCVIWYPHRDYIKKIEPYLGSDKGQRGSVRVLFGLLDKWSVLEADSQHWVFKRPMFYQKRQSKK